MFTRLKKRHILNGLQEIKFLKFTLATDKKGGLTRSRESPGIGGESTEKACGLVDKGQVPFTHKGNAVVLGAS